LYTLFTLQVFALHQVKEISNQEDWNTIFEQAKEEDKYIYVFIYSDVCGFCDKMKKEVLHSDSIAKIMQLDFIGIKVNGEHTFGTALVKKFTINDYPVNLFFNQNQLLLYQVDGFTNKNTLYKKIKALNEYKLSKNFYHERLELGTLDKEKAYDYSKLLFDAGQIEKANEIAQLYLEQINSQDLLLTKNKFIVDHFITDIESSHFSFLIHHEKELITQYGEAYFNTFIKHVFDTALQQAIADTNKQQVDNIVDKVLSVYLSSDSFEEGKSGTHQLFYLGTAQWEKYNASVFSFYHLSESVSYLRNKSEYVIEHYYATPELLAFAENWLNIVEKYENTYKTQLLYGTVLTLQNKNKEALKKATKAEKYALTIDQKAAVQELIILINNQP
jgi:thioredoxin-related protein